MFLFSCFCFYSNDAEPNVEGPAKTMPLHDAAEAGHADIVRLLLRKGASQVPAVTFFCLTFFVCLSLVF